MRASCEHMATTMVNVTMTSVLNDAQITDANQNKIKNVLTLITLACQSGAFPCLPLSTSRMLSKLLESIISARKEPIAQNRGLRRVLLSCLASFESHRLKRNEDVRLGVLNKAWSEEAVYALALETSGTDLVLSSTFV